MEQFYLLVTSLLTTVNKNNFLRNISNRRKSSRLFDHERTFDRIVKRYEKNQKHLFFYLNLIFLYYNFIINYYKSLLFLDSHFESHRYFSNI